MESFLGDDGRGSRRVPDHVTRYRHTVPIRTGRLDRNDERRPHTAPAPQTEEKLGTAHGAREWSVVSMVPFERASRGPQWISQIEYDTYDNLVASGVIPPSPYAQHRPRPFPLNPDGAGFVPDPPADP